MSSENESYILVEKKMLGERVGTWEMVANTCLCHFVWGTDLSTLRISAPHNNLKG